MGSLRVMQHLPTHNNNNNNNSHTINKNNNNIVKPAETMTTAPKKVLVTKLQIDMVDPNHSPLGSPPVEKKRLRRLSHVANSGGSPPTHTTSRLVHAAGGGSPPTHTSSRLAHADSCSEDEKENRVAAGHCRLSAHSILKKHVVRPTCAAMTSSSGVGRCSHRRRVVFSGQVRVQYIGDKDEVSEPLVSQHRDRHEFIARNILRKAGEQTTTSSCSTAQASLSVKNNQQQSSFHVNPIYRAPTTAPASPAPRPPTSHDVNISFYQNSRHGTTLKFVLYMGLSYDPDNIVVKANMSGNRLRVVASEVGGAAQHEYNERFQLPMPVDPYKVEARLDGRGYLTVNAPLVGAESSSRGLHHVEQQPIALSA